MKKRNGYTQEEKRAYYANLRQEWATAKLAAEGNERIEKLRLHLLKMGVETPCLTNIALVLTQAEALGLDGLPYLDFKTYKAWQQAGFHVRKGEQSQVYTITWVGVSKTQQNADDGQDEVVEGKRWPKVTALFHTSQVEEAVA